MYMCIHICIYIHLYIYIYMYMCIYIYIHVCLCVYVCVCLFVCLSVFDDTLGPFGRPFAWLLCATDLHDSDALGVGFHRWNWVFLTPGPWGNSEIVVVWYYHITIISIFHGMYHNGPMKYTIVITFMVYTIMVCTIVVCTIANHWWYSYCIVAAKKIDNLENLHGECVEIKMFHSGVRSLMIRGWRNLREFLAQDLLLWVCVWASYICIC